MAVTTCVKCGGRMSAEAAVCPHCAARQPARDPAEVRKAMSPDEIRALLMTSGDSRNGGNQSAGLLSTLVFPHPATTGAARAVEIALTIVCAPLILAGTIALGLRRRAARAKLQDTTGEIMPVFVMSFFGALPLDFLLSFAGVEDGWVRFGMIVGSIGALCVRGVLRARAAGKGTRDLLRIEKG